MSSPGPGEIGGAYSGNRFMGITPLAAGVLSMFSDNKDPVRRQRSPATDWIAYTGADCPETKS